LNYIKGRDFENIIQALEYKILKFGFEFTQNHPTLKNIGR